MPYAKGTTVLAEKSRLEIQAIVNRHGATAFNYAERTEKAMIQFEMKDRVVRFILPFPSLDDCATRKVGGKWRQVPHNQRQSLREQICRERWRALRIAILAKLEAVEAGIEQFEESFLGQIVDPISNRTVYELIQPRLAVSYSENPKPLGLPSPAEVE